MSYGAGAPADAAGSRHSRVIGPTAITGPVGWPVGEPPGGSSEMASAASVVASAMIRRGTDERHRLLGVEQPQRSGILPRHHQPQLRDAVAGDDQIGRHRQDGLVAPVDGCDQGMAAIAGQLRHHERRARHAAEIDERADTGRRQQPAREREAAART